MDLAFADCVLSLTSQQLIRGGVAVALEPKMYALLEVLIQRRPAVVTNVELDEILWPKVYVARTSLTRLVSELRAVLGDSPRDSRIIRTVYKTGYAFAANVKGAHVRPIQPSAEVSLIWKAMTLPLADGENIAGRGSECSVVVDAKTVSRRHARITVQLGSATVEDLGSTNGTYVNKVAVISPTRLNDGDEISFGSVLLKLQTRNPSALTERDMPQTGEQRGSSPPSIRPRPGFGG
jgi:DNA-binding winged helix-turn-helix (wHTH) protein